MGPCQSQDWQNGRLSHPSDPEDQQIPLQYNGFYPEILASESYDLSVCLSLWDRRTCLFSRSIEKPFCLSSFPTRPGSWFHQHPRQLRSSSQPDRTASLLHEKIENVLESKSGYALHDACVALEKYERTHKEKGW